MFNEIDTICHGFASIYITYILIYRDISIIYFSFALFSRLKCCIIFATPVRPFFMDVVWILFINLSFVLGLLGLADMCKIRAKLVHGNDTYVFTSFTLFEQILKIHNSTRPRNKPG